MTDFERVLASFPTREEMHRMGQAARLGADDGVTPEVGRYYTVSPDFVHGDRSWIERVWRVIALSGPNVQVEIIGAGWDKGTDLKRIVRVDERAWYPADHIAPEATP
jgi:hypothetical protein